MSVSPTSISSPSVIRADCTPKSLTKSHVETREYHVIYLFFIDPYHDYPHKALAAYSPSAEAKAEEVTALEQVSDVEQYFADHDALDEDDLRDLLP